MTKQKIRILYLGPNLFSKVGGAKKVMLDIVNNLEQSRFSTGILFVKGDPQEIRKIKKHVRLFDFRWISKIRKSGRLSNLCIIYTILAFKPDIVLIAGRRFGFFFSNKLKKLFPKTKFIFRMGGVISDSETNDIDYVEWLKTRYSKADAIICASQATKEQYISKLGISHDIISVVYNGIDLQNICDDNSLKDSNIRRLENSKVCCYVGALNERKDPLTLIKAFEIAKQSIPNLALWIVGEGMLEKELQEYCKFHGLNKFVQFLGYKQNPYPYMKESDLFLSASTRDGFGLTLLEAAALRKPFFYANGVIGIAELLKKYDVGRYFPPHDFLSLSSLIISFFKSEEKYSFDGYEKLVDELSMSKFIQGYSNIFEYQLKNN
ncbi:glycosyltransferase [Leptothoe sp. LEGE 181152]|nr:glycosyltransferase [Leptothoe sp. LEGE 181152]